jgi:hypothetical protein
MEGLRQPETVIEKFMKNLIVILVVLLLAAIVVHRFYNKTQLSFKLICKVKDSTGEFRPLGYEFFHTRQELDSYFDRNKETKELKIKLDGVIFDFNKYSYSIFYGREVESMFYSYKSTYFDDITPSYARPNGKVPVFVTYENVLPNTTDSNCVYIYGLDKDARLRGFYD